MKIPNCPCGQSDCSIHEGMVPYKRTNAAAIELYGEVYFAYPGDHTEFDKRDAIEAEKTLRHRKP